MTMDGFAKRRRLVLIVIGVILVEAAVAAWIVWEAVA